MNADVMTTAEFIDQLKEQDIHLRLEGDQIRVNAPRGMLRDELRLQLTARKEELRALLAALRRENENEAALLPLRPRPERLPLSFAQQRLWFLHQLESEKAAYHISMPQRLTGRLNVSVLERALQEIIRRHEALRTVFVVQDGEPWQVVLPEPTFKLVVTDLAHLPSDKAESLALEMARQETRRPFDLAADLMLRAALVRLTETDHVLVMTIHHIAADGWSIGILLRELTALYAAFLNDQPSPLADLPLQYADYAVWQRAWLQGERLERQLAYWRTQLAGLHEMTLPTSWRRPDVLSMRGAAQYSLLQPQLVDALRSLAQQEGATLHMVLLAAFAVLLARYTGQDDIAVGTPTASRTKVEVEQLIGFFVNTLVMRVDLSGNPSFRTLLQRVRHIALDAYAHQEAPFEKLVDEFSPARRLNVNPLISVMFQLQEFSPSHQNMAGLVANPIELPRQHTKFDLDVALTVRRNGVRGAWRYAADLFDAATIQRLVGHYQSLLVAIVAEPDCPVQRLPLLSDAERQQLLVAWNDTTVPYPRDLCVHQLFEEQAARTPDATALLFGDHAMSYAQLNAQANRLAQRLRGEGVGRGELVGLYMRRSPELLVAMLAILKAGGAYLPLDPAHPSARLAFMLTDAGLKVVLTLSEMASGLPGSATVVCVDHHLARRRDAGSDDEPANFLCTTNADDLIYVMYTSGSAGAPKGVEIRHRAVLRLVCGADYAPLGPQQTLLQLAPISFDASTLEIWGALLHGAPLVLAPDGMPDYRELQALIARHGVTVLWLTAGLFNSIIDLYPQALTGVRTLLVGGQALSVPHVRKAQRLLPTTTLINGYGPTENTTFTTCYRIPADLPESAVSVPIGRPIANTQVYVLDAHLQLAPIGVTGELYAGGDGVARGYLNRPELTAERFVPHPFRPGERLYRTGDLAYWRQDGLLEFVGRVDDQVKIRGNRVEPGEVEASLARHPGLAGCAVIVRPDRLGDASLVAYVVARHAPAPSSSELGRFLRTTLPEYMIPAAFVPIETMPLMLSGKLDRNALPAVTESTSERTSNDAAPVTEQERRLAAVWSRVLGLDKIGVNDSFFDLGGHSLLGVRLFAAIEEEFNVRLPLTLLFQAQTVAQLAQHLDQPQLQDGWSILTPIQEGGHLAPFFCVHGVGGGVLGYADLARALGSGQPFWGLQAAGLNGEEQFDETIEAMAQRYIAAMRRVQPSGPYRLGGYCLGGVVAFEMARQLEAQGEAIALVAIMEGHAPARYRAHTSWLDRQRLRAIWHNIPYWADDYWHLGAAGLRIRARRKLQQWRKRLLQRLGRHIDIEPQDLLPEDLSGLPRYQMELLQIHMAAVRRYAPQPYGGRVTLFLARGKTISTVLFGSVDRELGWGKLAAGGVEIRVVDGGHRNIHLPPNVHSLAAALRECLQAADCSEKHERGVVSDDATLAPNPTTNRPAAA